MGSVFGQGKYERIESIRPLEFLDVCHYCDRRLVHGRDIFMYRGDVAFCSEECRYYQISADEGHEKRTISASRKGSIATVRDVNSKGSAEDVSSETAIAA